jgi:hypothetical protein
MGFLNTLFGPIAGDDAYHDPSTIYKNITGEHGGIVQNLDDPSTVFQAVAGHDGILNEVTEGDGLGLGHVLGSESVVGQLLGADDGG